MTRPISREDFDSMAKKISEEQNVPKEIVRKVMLEKLDEAGLFLQEAPLVEQIARARIEASEQMVITHLQQFERGLKYPKLSIVE